MKTTKFDPLEYIEKGFLDRPKKSPTAPESGLDDKFPSIGEYLVSSGRRSNGARNGVKFRKTELRAPRPRRTQDVPTPNAVNPEVRVLLDNLPKHIEFLSSFFDDEVTSKYYGGDFKESRTELIHRLLDPELSLEETSRLLGVCPATVRRYTNRGWLTHHRTSGGQRRFRLSDVVQFVERHGRLPEE